MTEKIVYAHVPESGAILETQLVSKSYLIFVQKSTTIFVGKCFDESEIHTKQTSFPLSQHVPIILPPPLSSS